GEWDSAGTLGHAQRGGVFLRLRAEAELVPRALSARLESASIGRSEAGFAARPNLARARGAETPVRPHGAQCQLGARLLQHPAGPRGGTGRTLRILRGGMV